MVLGDPCERVIQPQATLAIQACGPGFRPPPPMCCCISVTSILRGKEQAYCWSSLVSQSSQISELQFSQKLSPKSQTKNRKPTKQTNIKPIRWKETESPDIDHWSLRVHIRIYLFTRMCISTWNVNIPPKHTHTHLSAHFLTMHT